MEKEMVLGPEAKAVLKIENGFVILSVTYNGAQASGQATVSLSIDEYAKMLKEAIPGQIDDTVITLLVGAMKML